MTHPVGQPEPFEQGMKALADYLNNEKFPAVPINPYDPAYQTVFHEEWESGYEYGYHLSKLPEKQ